MPQVAVDERRAAPAPPEMTSQDWSSQYLIFLTSLARTSSQPLQLLHLQRCACTRSQHRALHLLARLPTFDIVFMLTLASDRAPKLRF